MSAGGPAYRAGQERALTRPMTRETTHRRYDGRRNAQDPSFSAPLRQTSNEVRKEENGKICRYFDVAVQVEKVKMTENGGG